MGWRMPDIGEMWEIALVVIVLLVGAGLMAGLPSAARDRGMHTDWACVAPVDGDTACIQRADRPLLEGRAVHKDLAK